MYKKPGGTIGESKRRFVYCLTVAESTEQPRVRKTGRYGGKQAGRKNLAQRRDAEEGSLGLKRLKTTKWNNLHMNQKSLRDRRKPILEHHN